MFWPTIQFLQIAAAIFVLLIYSLAIIAIKWWAYPGWTWRGYLSDLEALVGIATFSAGCAAWLFKLYRNKSFEEAANQQTRLALQSKWLERVVLFSAFATIILSSSLVVFRESLPSKELLELAKHSNWKHARELLIPLGKEPLRPEVIETLRLYVSVHEQSEKDLLKESRSLREDRERVLTLVREGYNPNCLNSLTAAELSKAIYFVEDAGERQQVVDAGLKFLDDCLLFDKSVLTRAALHARKAEILLAARNYELSRSTFQLALETERDPVRIARIRASLGNTFAATNDLAKAVDLYNLAEKDYPEGRRSIYFSNFGYLLMLTRDFKAAKQKVEQAIQIDATDWYSFLNLGLIKEQLGDFDDAYEDFAVVMKNSANPDSRREARILGGRCLELAGRNPDDYLKHYLEAAGRSTSAAQVSRIRGNSLDRAALYEAMAKSLEHTNTHAIEPYIDWFRQRAKTQAQAQANSP